MKKIKKYYVNPDDSAVLAMSVVDEPAIESEFVYLSKQKVDKFVALENNERHMIYGCALRPDFPIYRRDEEEEYYLEFSKEAVEKLARNFMIDGLQQNFTTAHRSEADGITITESWIKTDMLYDKSVALGLDAELPVGSWIIGAYCDNADVWEKVKAGTFHGFSVEAIVNVNELAFEAEAPVAEPVVEPAPAQEPVVETPVQEEPTVEVKESILDRILNFINPSMDKPTETPVDEPKVEEPTVEPEPEQTPVTEPQNEPEPQPNPLDEVVSNLKAEIEALKARNTLLESERDALTKKVDDMASLPSVKPTNVNTGNGGGDAFKNWRDQMEKYFS